MAEFLNHGNRSVKISEIAEIETTVCADSTVVRLWGRRPEPLVLGIDGNVSVSDVVLMLSRAAYAADPDVYWMDLLD